jgi:hypothetical protein
VPLGEGLEAARRHVESAGRTAVAIAGFELRIPKQLSREGFTAFNAPYVERLAAMGLTSDDGPVTTRTNVAPTVPGVAEPSVHAFTYTVPGRGRTAVAFRLSGAAETRTDGTATERLATIVDELDERMDELGVRWADATAASIYGPEGTMAAVDAGLLARVGAGGLRGLTWYPCHPPVEGIDYEIDAMGAGTELTL